MKYIRLNKYIILGFFLLILIIFPLCFPLGFSPDSINYFNTLKLNVSNFNFFKFEPLYWLFVYLNQKIFHGNWDTFLLFFSIPYVVLSSYLIFKKSLMPLLSLFTFVIIFYPKFGLIQIRDGASIIFLWIMCFSYINNKKVISYISFLFAVLTHYAAIVFVIIYLLNKKKINIVYYLFLPFLGIFIGKALNINFFYFIANYLPVFIKFKLLTYITLLEYDNMFNKIHIFNTYVLFISFIYYLSLFLIKYKDVYLTIYIKIIGIALFGWFFFQALPVISFRLSNDFFSFMIFLIPYVVYSFKKRAKDINIYYLIYILSIIFILIVGWNIYIRHGVFNWNIV